MEQEIKKFKQLKIIITGYDSFMNVLVNPTISLLEVILNNRTKLDGHPIDIIHNEIYKVSCDYVDENIEKYFSLIDRENNGGQTLYLVVHFGVNTSTKEIALECSSRNEINDRLRKIGRINPDGEMYYRCRLNLELLCSHLVEKGYPCVVSNDAGDYLCNYIYYKSSMKFCCTENVFPVFIHIPSAEVCSVEKCSSLFYDLIIKVAETFI